MTYTIHITAKAERDIIEAADYIEYTLLNPKAADDLLDLADAEISSLATMPQKYQLVDDPVLSAWGIRLLVINNYLAFYTVDESAGIVHIVRFLYGKRNWMSILRNEPIQLD